MKKRDIKKTIANSLLVMILAITLFNTYGISEVNAEPLTFTQNFSYTGNEQTLTIPYNGYYKLETWGAQGGEDTATEGLSTDIGGYGGYSVGTMYFNKDDIIYLNIGGRGINQDSNNVYTSTKPGGYNGGGSNNIGGSYGLYVGVTGGGATHIATSSGLLSTFEEKQEDLLIVAGGGGGASSAIVNSNYSFKANAGGPGGGYIGRSGYTVKTNGSGVTVNNATGGTQTEGGNGSSSGSFGQGANSTYTGGGGYYGGGGSTNGAGGGGSGYIGNSNLKDKQMVCYNCDTSDEESTKTISNTCASGTATADCSKTGNGYAKVTLVKEAARLDGIEVADGKGYILEDFDETKYEYTWVFTKNIETFTSDDLILTPLADYKFRFVQDSLPNTKTGDQFQIIAYDENVEENTNTYTITMQRFISSDGTLSDITSDKGEFKEPFLPETRDYTLEVFENASQVTLTGVPNEQDNQGVVYSYGDNQTNTTGVIPLNNPEEDVTITSTAEDGTVEVYSVHIIKDMYLKNITINGLGDLECKEGQCILDPEFDKAKEDYYMAVPFDYETLDTTYVPSHEGLKVEVMINGDQNYEDNPNIAKTRCNITYNVYNDDHIVKTYTIDFLREREEDSLLSDLKVKDGKGYLKEDFNVKKFDYTWVIPKDMTEASKDDLIATLFNKSTTITYPNNTVTYTQDGDTFVLKVNKPNVDEFGYYGDVQEFVAPYAGTYKLEVWGASGGTAGLFIPSLGGYSVGTTHLNKGQSVYIYVGGQGSVCSIGYGSNRPYAVGGYNGGGACYASKNGDYVRNSGAGGGATHIATVPGLLNTLENNKNDILIVAGGGGGSYQYYKDTGILSPLITGGGGASGGGYLGATGTYQEKKKRSLYGSSSPNKYGSKGGSQTAGGAGNVAGTFGQGATSWNGGGGGFYGGGASGNGVSGYNQSGAGGGSGYIGNSKLTSEYGITKHMTCYSCATSSAADTKTNSNSQFNMDATPKADQPRFGNGYAKITMLEGEGLSATYTLTLEREVSDDARLATLTATSTDGEPIFEKEFNPDTTEPVVIEFFGNASDITLDGTPMEQDATIIDGLGTIELTSDETHQNITVQAEDGTIKVYEVIIRKNMYITDLGLNGLEGLTCKDYECHITPEFTPETANYEYRVPLDYNILDAYYEKANDDHRIEMTINDEPYVDGYVLPFTGTTVVKVNIYNDNDEISKTYTMNVIKSYDLEEGFDYTGEEQEFDAPRTGTYKIEVWGAQGGDSVYGSNTAIGGYGAYSVGTVDLAKSDQLHIIVGGKGQSVSRTSSTVADNETGYNGGGYGSFVSDNSTHGGGGGASHVATSEGLLVDFKDNTSNLLMVAGGGGGASTHKSYPSYSGNGGSGGGIKGVSGITSNSTCYNYGNGGTQTGVGLYTKCSTEGRDNSTNTLVAADFGKGQNFTAYKTNETYAGGGAGYYGGGAGYHGPGGGGSGYIGSSDLLSNDEVTKHMTCYNCETSDEDSTRTYSNECHSTTPTPDCSKEGNGFIKVTLIDSDTTLSSLSVKSGNLVETFSPTRSEYTWIIPKDKDTFTSADVEAVLAHPDKAHLEMPTSPVQFTQDGDKFTFKVVGNNGEEETYTLTMERIKDSEARLKSLIPEESTLSPEFDPDTNEYTLDLYKYTNSFYLEGETMSPNATVSGLGAYMFDGKLINHNVTVTAEDGTVNTYLIHVRGNAYLLYLGLNGLGEVPCVGDECTLTPTFEPSETNYSIKVPYEYNKLDVYYMLTDPDQSVKVKVDNVEVSNYSLPVGTTKVDVELYNDEDILLKTYTMNVIRQKGSDATLDNLEVSEGDLDVPFSKEKTEYTWILPSDKSTNLQNYISYTTTDPSATVQLVPSSISYSAVGDKFDIVVTAEDGVTTKTYTINLQQDIIEDFEVEDELIIDAGEYGKVKAKSLPEGTAARFIYSIDDDEIAEMYEDGKVYGLKGGKAVISVNPNNHPEMVKYVLLTVVDEDLVDEAYLIGGSDLTDKLSGLANNTGEFKKASFNEYYAVKDILTDDNIISTNDSPYPDYLWVNCEDTYYYSLANTIYLAEDSSNMFENSKYNKIDLSKLNTTRATNMSSMFKSSSATEIDLSSFNTSNVTSMSSMFEDSSVTSVDFTKFNTSNVTNMSSMFKDASINSYSLRSFDTSNVTDMSSMFENYEGTELDLSMFNTSSVTNMNNMFSGNTNISTIYASELWSTDNVTNGINMFSSDTNIVGEQGTTYDGSHINSDYAHIDEGSTNPGYLTYKKFMPKIYYPDGLYEEVEVGYLLTLADDYKKSNETVATVTFDYNDDNMSDTYSYVEKQFIFNKWSINGIDHAAGEVLVINSDTYLDADYTETIIGAEFPRTPYKENNKFVGWYTEETGGELVEEYDLEEDITLYAHWIEAETVPVTYTNGDVYHVPVGEEFDLGENNVDDVNRELYYVYLDYNMDDGSDPVKETVYEMKEGNGWLIEDNHYDNNAIITVNEPITVDFDYDYVISPVQIPQDLTRDGYGFAGWYHRNTNNKLEETEWSGPSDLDLYAKWVYDPVNLTIDGKTEIVERGYVYTVPNGVITNNDKKIHFTLDFADPNEQVIKNVTVGYGKGISYQTINGSRYEIGDTYTVNDDTIVESMMTDEDKVVMDPYVADPEDREEDGHIRVFTGWYMNGWDYVDEADINVDIHSVTPEDISLDGAELFANFTSYDPETQALIHYKDEYKRKNYTKVVDKGYEFSLDDISENNTFEYIFENNVDDTDVRGQIESSALVDHYLVNGTEHETGTTYTVNDETTIEVIRVVSTAKTCEGKYCNVLDLEEKTRVDDNIYMGVFTDRDGRGQHIDVSKIGDHLAFYETAYLNGYIYFMGDPNIILKVDDEVSIIEKGPGNIPAAKEKVPDHLVTITFDYNDGNTRSVERYVDDVYTFDHYEVEGVGNYDAEAEYDYQEDTTMTSVYNKSTSYPELIEVDDVDFLGWYTDKTNGDKVESLENIDSDTTLYAHWNKTLPTDIEIESEDITVVVGETYQIDVTFIPDGSIDVLTYADYDNEKISVTEDGLITGLATGETTITIGLENVPNVTKTINVTIVNNLLASDIYEVRDVEHEDLTTDRIVIGAEDGTLISEFKANMLNPDEYIKIYDENDNEVLDDDIVKTGLTIKLEYNGLVLDEAKMVVRGDVDGDGFVNVTDYIAVLNHALALEDIEDYASYAAGDVEEDDILNVTDYIKIMDYALGNIDSINN